MNKGNGEKLLKPREAANYLGIAIGTLHRHRKSGRGPDYVQIEGVIRYDKTKLDLYIQQKGVKP